MLDPQLTMLAESLVTHRRQERNERIFAQLKKNEYEAAAKRTLGAGFYKRQQMDLCIAELRERAADIRAAYERVVVEAGVPWSDGLRDQIVERVRAEIIQDAAYLEERARNVIVQHGHGFELFLTDEARRVVERASAETDLFGFRRRGGHSALVALLAAPRYEAPAKSWTAALDCRKCDPPDHIGAAREAIHTVEGLARLATGQLNATLGDCIKELQRRRALHPGTIKQLDGLWAISSAVQGLRHGAAVPPDIADAELAHVMDSAEAVGVLLVRVDAGAT